MKILFLLLSLYAHAEVLGQHRGGGDELGLSLRADLANAYTKFLQLPVSRNADLAALAKAYGSLKLLVVDDPLTVDLGGVSQNGAAENDPSRDLILVNRARWAAITNPSIREAVLLHELLSLAKAENTGFYPFSSEYLRAVGLSPVSLFTLGEEPKPDPTKGLPVYFLRFKTHQTGLALDTKTDEMLPINPNFTDTTSMVTRFQETASSKIYSFQITHGLANSNLPSQFGLSISTASKIDDNNTVMATQTKAFLSMGRAFSTNESKIQQQLTKIPGGYFYHLLATDNQNLGQIGYDTYGFFSWIDAQNGYQTVLTPNMNEDVSRTNGVAPGRYMEKFMQQNHVAKVTDESEFLEELLPAQRQAFDDFKSLHLRTRDAGAKWKACTSNCAELEAAYRALDTQRDAAFFSLIQVKDLRIPRPNVKPKPKHSSGGGGWENRQCRSYNNTCGDGGRSIAPPPPRCGWAINPQNGQMEYVCFP